jgi:hypothetical protein
MNVDPRIGYYLNGALVVVAGLTTATSQFTTLFGEGATRQIMAAIGLTGIVLGAINTWLHGSSAPAAGPLVK